MCIGVVGFQQALIVMLSAFGEADEAVTFTHLEADAVALFFLVAAHFAVGLFVAVGGLGVLFAAKGEVGVLGGISSLRIQVAAHKDEQGRHKDKDVSFHRHKFSFFKRKNGIFILSDKSTIIRGIGMSLHKKNPAVSSGID